MSAPIVHGGGLAAAVANYGGRIEDWLDLSTGINPCPPELPDIPARAWHRLPDKELEQAAREAARHFYRSAARVPLPVPGTQSVIQLLPRLVPPGQRVAVMSPTYGEYVRTFELAGITVDKVTDLDAIQGRHGLVVVVNPNNPDGRILSADALRTVAERLAASGGFLVVDEAFGEVDSEQSLAGCELENVVVFRSFGKFFGMAGLRLGFVIANDALAVRFADWLGPWAVSGPALSVAAALFSRDVQPICTRIAERAAALRGVLREAGLGFRPGPELFLLVETPEAANLHDHLCRAHILTRKFDYAPAWLRFGLAPDQQSDQRLAAALAAWRRSQ